MGALLDAVTGYAQSGVSRFHMPGHKGKPLGYLGFGDISALDVTEVAGMDSLYTASGVIREVERGYAQMYGSHDCFLSAGGSTLCIQAMLAAALRPGEKLLISRGAHAAAVNAMALLDLHPEWILPATHPGMGLSRALSAQDVAEALKAHPDMKAVYVTSPTFFGVCADIAGIARVCGEHSLPLLVDNAHGAHLHFFGRHPIALGADMCCDSLHKTLPVLTGGAILHVGGQDFAGSAREKMSLFGSTSPSYLVMSSIDGALGYMRSGEAAQGMAWVANTLERIGQAARGYGYLLPADMGDPLRLTLCAAGLGYTGEALGEHLRKHKVEPEYAGGGCAVLMASPLNSEDDFARLRGAVEKLPRKEAIALDDIEFVLPQRVMSIRQAVFARRQTLPVDDAVGRVAGALVSPCPPGIALVCAGERIDGHIARLLKKYGISRVSVVE